ncbi:unnamed protein product [Aphanomyces euteiches]|uniref:Uncharacterized protein n=1 Tax=Aphanomyces euteiches TaxID=100861 RepID=A0A6G0X5X7_9STRA|nr:hypothetical protein Ae201684_008259 [Aphanomyces euteiches]KAH9070552.1 hypothetical protein Ae201684P_002909 [Aphanomyces euteiches]
MNAMSIASVKSTSDCAILYTVTTTQLQVLQVVLQDLWEFGPDTIDPVTPETLQKWANQGELAVALQLKPQANTMSIQDALDTAIHQRRSCDSVQAVGTVRMANIRTVEHTRQALIDNFCPPCMFSQSLPLDTSSFSLGLYSLTTQSFEPHLPLLGSERIPRVHVGRDSVSYSTTGFVRRGVRGSGLYQQLAMGKSLSYLPEYCRTVQGGNKAFWFFTVSDHEGGRKLALAYMKMIGASMAAVAKALKWGNVSACRVVHWGAWDPAHNIPIRGYLVCMDPRVECLRLAKL